MDLKSGCLFWPQLDGEARHYAPLREDRDCDVAVIGGGITGAMSAYHLTRAGLRVVLLDRRDVARGSTGASTGLLQYEIDRPLVELKRLVGEAAAVRSYRLGVESFEKFRATTEAIGDDCGYRPRTSLFCATDAQDVPLFRAECDARRACGIRVDFLSEGEVAERFSFRRPAALLSHDAAEIDPYRLTTRLIEYAASRGLEVFGGTEVRRYLAAADDVTIWTDAGGRVRARHVVFATGYETPEFLDASMVKLKSTYAFVSNPVETFAGWEDRCLIWESGTPYFYARTTPDGRIIAGGEDEDFADPARRDALIGAKTRTLAGKLRAMFPAIPFRPACAWAGTFAETKDSLPLIGPHPAFPRGQFALGYGGNGITFGLIAAEIIRDQLTGKPNADAEVFRFGR